MAKPRVTRVCKLKPGDRFSFRPAAWYGPGIVTESYGNRVVMPDFGNPNPKAKVVDGTWALKFDNRKVVNPPGVWYGHPDTKVTLLGRGKTKTQKRQDARIQAILRRSA